MASTRKTYLESQNVALLSQVNRICPLCTEPLFYKKGGKSYKDYQIAHIYPLNPTAAEIALLASEKKLSADVNDENNVIPLCTKCHAQFDKPRTIEEYRLLYDLKNNLIDRSGQQAIWHRYAIEDEIAEVIEAIYNDPELENESEIDFQPKEVDDKLDETISRPTKRKIKNNVNDYYIFIKKRFASLDQAKGDLSDIISLQIKTYYLKQKQMGFSQQVIFENLTAWIHAKTKSKTTDAAEILTSFFVQNCEVF